MFLAHGRKDLAGRRLPWHRKSARNQEKQLPSRSQQLGHSGSTPPYQFQVPEIVPGSHLADFVHPPEFSAPVIPCEKARVEKMGMRGLPILFSRSQRWPSSPGRGTTSQRGPHAQEPSVPQHPRTLTIDPTLRHSV